MASGLRRFASLFAGLIAAAAVSGTARGGDVAPDAAPKPAPTPAKPRPVNFAREVRPILSDSCFACHGPDDKQRKAKLRLDVHEGVLAKLESGDAAVVPGKVDDSSLAFRIETDDAEMLMPPKSSGKTLTPQQIDVLKRWIAEGAHWGEHWAFEPPVQAAPPAPDAANKGWARTPIDRFLLARIEAEGLKPSREAEPATLLRRAYLDLTGLPPTPADSDAFLADAAKGLDAAYEKAVDRLLDSPRYGEHMARFWLDAARYGDTHGLHLDNFREMWPYRDWVVNAFNANKPFDQFIVEQLAGDLLPNPTHDQVIATGFNRCHVSTSEGGSIEEEVYVRNVVDQVDTNSTVFLGLTVGCARCHDHKYDPVRQKDYYQLFAFFNNIDGPALDGNVSKWAPIVKVPSAEQTAALKAADAKLADLRGKLAAEAAKAVAAYDPKVDEGQSEVVQRGDFVWLDDAPPAGSTPQGDGEFVAKPDHPVLTGKAALRIEAAGLKQKIFEIAGPKLKVGEGDSFFTYVFIDPIKPPKEIMLQWRVGSQWSHRAFWGENVIPWGKDGTTERTRIGDLPASGSWVRIEVAAKTLGLAPGTVIDGWAFTQHDGAVYWDKAGLSTWTPQEGQTYGSLTAWVRARSADGGMGLADPIKAIVKKPRAGRTDDERKQLLAAFVENGWTTGRSIFEPLLQQIAKTDAERKAVDEAISTTLVFRERVGEPKPAFLLNRGEYDQRRDKVGRATPAFLPPLPPGSSVDRLGLARWLVAPNHPLTARVAVNRFWLHVFGTGIVKTAEDFGSQGEPPSHPELLDWLAVQFRDEGWDVKRFVKRMVMSAAYRQTSQTSAESLAKDPDNRLLSRGPRFRLDAETLRDQAFFVSGMLVERVGGPSVKPPQPAGLWEAVAYTGSNTARFTADTGAEKVHRRSMYTFWKRTSPPPQMTTLDAPSRESCQVRRERTNTPLQALLLLNEPQYVEASRVLAERTLREAKPTPEERLRYMFRLATARQPDARDLAELSAALQDLSAHYAKQPEAAKALIEGGEFKPDAKLDPSELAAWTMIGNILLNLDEVVTKG
ncbi:MAG: PSD1 and planctomycete cytochrome C domain-containing protein [Paludisphaera borealis]|uniref:PSD1 and planctomycete cytochrome C domain-containing protein n=1 Tax=Paludisphaera borealis TaxID=1387353 RepID=UPI0028418665|nr:PSD1 and planctomycete cytochrome C domain-containing protein [Paludisphaera borealis]MDR3618476.1 PSD1 and planctomycete cytochrome C domain-containing protein [Paludisphaera borealis]